MQWEKVFNIPYLSLRKLYNHTKNKWLWLLMLFIAYCFFSDNEIRLSPNQFWQKRSMPAVNIDDVMVYVISLDRTPERYASVKASLDRAGLKHQRFSAVDGYLLEMIDEKGQHFTGADIKNGNYKLAIGRKYTIKCPSGDVTYAPNRPFKKPFTAGEIGVLCSHRGIWQDMLKHGYKNAIIFEDDIVVNSRFRNIYPMVLENLPYNYDLMFMIYEIDKSIFFPKVARIINNDYVFKVLANETPIWYLAAYMLSDRGAHKLFNNVNTYDKPIDHIDGIANGLIKAYTVADQKYAMLQEKEGLSAITAMGRKL